MLEQTEADRPPAGTICRTYFAEVAGIYHVHGMVPALLPAPLHLWSEETVRARFTYRTPGLYVLPVRVYRVAQAFDLADTPEYAGCRSWVDLGRELPTEEAIPVLDDAAFRDRLRTLD